MKLHAATIFIKKDTLVKMFSCECWETFNTCYTVFTDDLFWFTLFRSSRSQIFFKINLFKNFVIFTNLKDYNLIKKRLEHRYFPVNTEKFLRTAFLQNTSADCLLLFISNICCFKFEINKRVLFIEIMMKFSNSR